MIHKSHYQHTITHERSVAPFIPQRAHIGQSVIVNEDGDLQRTWKIQGVAFETADDASVTYLKNQLNTLIRSMGSNQVALWNHQVHRRTGVELPMFAGGYPAEFNARLGQHLNRGKVFTTELYLTLIFRPTPSRAMRAVVRAGRRNTADILTDQHRAVKQLDDLSRDIEATLERYQLTVLGLYTNKTGAVCSSALSFLNYLTCNRWQEVQATYTPINQSLGDAQIVIGAETIEILSPDRTRWAQCIELKIPGADTDSGLYNGLLYQPFEYVITQSFSLLDKADALTTLRRQKKYLVTTEDAGASQIDALDVAMDDLTSNRLALGEYHFVMTVYGDSPQQTNDNATAALADIKNAGFIGCLSGTATDSAWYSQYPCNWFHRPRVWHITSRNYAGMACYHNHPTGKRTGNPWGDCLTCFQTPSGQPYYFSYHACPDDADYTGEQLVGSTLITGKSGEGKSLLLNRLKLQAQRYDNLNTVTFDIDQVARGTIEAMDGCYMTFENGQDSGCNPFQMDVTEGNILLLESLVKTLASENGAKPLTDSDVTRITHATRAVMRLPKADRRLSVLLQSLPTDPSNRENSLTKRLAKWCADDGQGNQGALWWALDCEHDRIDLTKHNNYGFDCSTLLDNLEVRTPVIQYLLMRLHPMIYGPKRLVVDMDEGFKFLANPILVDMIGNALPTWRKHDALLVLSTQSPATIKNSSVYDALSEQIATSIHLPNPGAKYDDYSALGCSQTEYETIQSFGEGSRLMIIKQNGHSVIAHNDLSGLDSDIAILSNKIKVTT